jgi:hypothetical protein
MTEPIQKRLTVTFKDVAVQVASLGEDYGSTVASVVTDLIPSFGNTRAEPRASDVNCVGFSDQLKLIETIVHSSRSFRPSTPRRNGVSHPPTIQITITYMLPFRC